MDLTDDLQNRVRRFAGDEKCWDLPKLNVYSSGMEGFLISTVDLRVGYAKDMKS